MGSNEVNDDKSGLNTFGISIIILLFIGYGFSGLCSLYAELYLEKWFDITQLSSGIKGVYFDFYIHLSGLALSYFFAGLLIGFFTSENTGVTLFVGIIVTYVVFLLSATLGIMGAPTHNNMDPWLLKYWYYVLFLIIMVVFGFLGSTLITKIKYALGWEEFGIYVIFGLIGFIVHCLIRLLIKPFTYLFLVLWLAFIPTMILASHYQANYRTFYWTKAHIHWWEFLISFF
ncbi:hypothetical protein [Parashewanella tropica]|uniref:hypothetical protein n=1 Tax=Parashewanella tropica TaxID=2547970 RepID=UPI00105A9BED|nr:hypothetical protein [Parashewanella tropica]